MDLRTLLRSSSDRTTGINEDDERIQWLRSQLIGRGAEFDTPFGKRVLTYADHTASGRCLRYVEDYIVEHVLPFYGNTHTSDSFVGTRTATAVHEAMDYIKRCMGAGGDDKLIFCGSGATSSIKRLQEIMGVSIPSITRRRVWESLRDEERWVVFVGPHEHHSNLLSWRQSLAEVVEIGAIDFENKVTKNIERNETRLKILSRQCSPLIQQSNLLTQKVVLCKQMLEIRSSNLQKAEAEVDLLGDEVDALLSLLGKIYIALDHYSPVLQHYPGVMEILKLVKRELEGETTRAV